MTGYATSNDTYVFRAVFRIESDAERPLSVPLWIELILEENQMKIEVRPYLENVSIEKRPSYYRFTVFIDNDFHGAWYDYAIVEGSTIYYETSRTCWCWCIYGEIHDTQYPDSIGIIAFLDTENAYTYYVKMWVLRYDWDLWRASDPDQYLDGEYVYGRDITVFVGGTAYVDYRSGETRFRVTIDFSYYISHSYSYGSTERRELHEHSIVPLRPLLIRC